LARVLKFVAGAAVVFTDDRCAHPETNLTAMASNKAPQTRLIGTRAIEYARRRNLMLSKFAEIEEPARDDLSIEAAEVVAARRPSLVFIDLDQNGERVEHESFSAIALQEPD
jgi:hypothetical protein